MMAATVAIGASLTVDRPRALFEGEFEEGGSVEPSRDEEPAVSHLVVIDNWFTDLDRLRRRELR